MSDAPLITIGITAYREKDLLSACWQSVLAQTDPRWEAVLVLDGGADAATRALFDSLSHPKLRKEAGEVNRGPYPTRNRAFALTNTPFHFYLDGDDQLLPDSVALVLGAFASHPEADFVYGDYQLFGDSARILHYPAQPSLDDYAFAQPVPGPCAYRVEAWRALGGFSDELARGNGDYDFHLGLAEAGRSGVHVGRPFYRYHTSQGPKVSRSYERRYHETHATMVARHPTLFADRRRRDRFLGLAHWRTAVACWNAAEPGQAMRHTYTALLGCRLAFDVAAWPKISKYALRVKWPRRPVTMGS